MTQDRAVEFVLGEFAEIVIDIFGGDFKSFVQGFTFGELGKSRGGGYSRSAAVSFPADVYDFISFFVYFNKHFHLIATDRVAHQAGRIALKLTFVAHQEVARVQKVILHNIGIDPILALVHNMIISQQVRYLPFRTRSLRPIVMGEASLIPLLVSRVRSLKADI